MGNTNTGPAAKRRGSSWERGLCPHPVFSEAAKEPLYIMLASSFRARAGVMLIVLGLAGCGQPWPEDTIDPTHPAKRAVGLEVYRIHCAACHGTRLEGQPDWHSRRADGRLPAPPHDASGPSWYRSDDELMMLVRNGMVPPLYPEGYQSDMPGFAGILSDDEIRAVLAWIQSTWPEELVEVRRGILPEGDEP